MMLNPDCVRDILLTVEECEDVSFPSNTYPLLNEYPEDVVLYHIKQCSYSGLFATFQEYNSGLCDISDLSPKGHEFISLIRSDTTLNKIKKKMGEIGAASISSIFSIAIDILKSSI